MVFLLERLAGASGDAPGLNTTPAQVNWAPRNNIAGYLECSWGPIGAALDRLHRCSRPATDLGIRADSPAAVSRGWFQLVKVAYQARFRAHWRRGFPAAAAYNGEHYRAGLLRIRPDHNLEITRLDHFVHVRVEQGKAVRSDRERDRLLFSRPERNALKSLEQFHWPRHRGYLLMNVHLGNFIACTGAGVGYIDADFCGAPGLDLRWLDAQAVELERRIAQPVTEGIERLTGAELVASIVGWLVIVEVGQVADGMRKGDGQFAAGTHVSKNHLSGGRTALFAQVPALENGRNLLRNVVDRKGATIEEENDGRLAGFNHRFDQIVLRAQQIEGIAVAAVHLRPGFTIRALVFSNHDDGDVGLACNRDGIIDFVPLGCGIDQLNIVPVGAAEPAVPVLALVGEAAAFRIEHLRLRSDPLLNAFENGYAVRWIAAVAAKVKSVSIRPDNRDGLQFIHIQWQQVVLVFQQNYRFLRRLQSHRSMLSSVGDFFRIVRVGIGMVKQAKPEFCRENAADRSIEF